MSGLKTSNKLRPYRYYYRKEVVYDSRTLSLNDRSQEMVYQIGFKEFLRKKDLIEFSSGNQTVLQLILWY